MARSLQPENIMESWSDWGAGLRSRPVLSGELSDGRSNRSYLLDSDIGKLVLRINGAGSLLPGANRDTEIRIWQEASRQGIAPPLVFVDTQGQYLVSRYIKNGLPPEPQLNPACVEQAFSLLDRTHQLDIDAPRINYFDHIEHYWRTIESRESPNPALIQQQEPMRLLLESLLASDTPAGLCHHDPVIANFVGTPDRLYLIDWEYAATGLQIMDYAALATEWQLDDSTVLKLSKCNPGRLTKAKRLYRYLCLLWDEASSQASFG
jgi:thiamine kinase-like enzyme